MAKDKNNGLKNIGLVLIAIVLLPVLFYTANEFNSLNETEEMVADIYERQIDALLFSVNQHTWDYINFQISKVQKLVDDPQNLEKDFFIEENPVLMANVYYLNFDLKSTYSSKSYWKYSDIFRNQLPEYFRTNRERLEKLQITYDKGYKKTETMMSTDLPVLEKDFFITLSILEDKNQKKIIVALLFNKIKIIRDVIQPKLREVAGDQFYVNIFMDKKIHSDYSFTDLEYSSEMFEKSLWIFPDLTIGMRSQGQDISEITEERFNKSLVLVFILNAVLIAGALFIYRNIGKEMRLAQLKSDFVSNVSHELRTPLSLIRMYAETLELGRIPNEEKKIQYYKNISQESERLTHLINNILNFSRMESGRKDYKFSENELNTLTKNIIQTYKDHIKESGFELKVDYHNRDINLKVDSDAISEALINLLDNSIKYSDKEKKISVTTGVQNGTAFIEVKDKGIGIAPENYDKIFEKFYRESTNNIHNTKGSGLGLSIVKHIMAAHDGWINVNAEQGNGSSFTLVFPKPKTID